MATQYTAKIPFNRIVKIGIWSNHTAKETLNQVYTKLVNKYPGKEIYISNGGFFNMVKDWSPCWGMKSDNVTYSDGWNNSCFMAMMGKEIKFFPQGSAFPVMYTDGITGYPALIEDGKKSNHFHNAPNGKSDRGRTMLGYTGDSVILSCISDVSGSSDYTLTEELNYMLKQGCAYAINLDGGGSTQCNFNGKKITSSRKVHNFVYIVANPDTSNPKKQYQTWLNQTYKSGLSADGSLGPATNKATIKGMQKELGITADGSWGPKSKSTYRTISLNGVYNTPNKIKLIQGALMRKGYWNSPLSDTFNTMLFNQVTLYQRANKITANGMVDLTTINSLFK